MAQIPEVVEDIWIYVTFFCIFIRARYCIKCTLIEALTCLSFSEKL